MPEAYRLCGDNKTGGDVIPLAEIESLHAVEAAHKYLAPLGISSAPGSLVVCPEPSRLAQLPASVHACARPIIGLHLSARKLSQRWSVENFSALARKLNGELQASFLILWSPGTQTNALHPGDDEKAGSFEKACAGLPVLLYPTNRLADLVAGMSICDLVICGDGGAMHIAAGLGKSVVALFGDSDPQRWRPWHVPSRVLQPLSRDVADIPVEEVAAAAMSLLATYSPFPEVQS